MPRPSTEARPRWALALLLLLLAGAPVALNVHLHRSLTDLRSLMEEHAQILRSIATTPEGIEIEVETDVSKYPTRDAAIADHVATVQRIESGEWSGDERGSGA